MKLIVLEFLISFTTQLVGRKELGAKPGGLQEAELGREHAENSGLKAWGSPDSTSFLPSLGLGLMMLLPCRPLHLDAALRLRNSDHPPRDT
jgi:hypothetical protein